MTETQHQRQAGPPRVRGTIVPLIFGVVWEPRHRGPVATEWTDRGDRP
jgi:hypothetical protein